MTPAEEYQPNLKALRRILFALVAAAVVTFTIAMTLILHPVPHKNVIRPLPRCACKGAGQCCRTQDHALKP